MKKLKADQKSPSSHMTVQLAVGTLLQYNIYTELILFVLENVRTTCFYIYFILNKSQIIEDHLYQTFLIWKSDSQY
jgi:hypothetical protein